MTRERFGKKALFKTVLDFLLERTEKFPHSPYLIMHVHLTGDTLNNKAPYMDV